MHHPALSGGTPNHSNWVCADTNDWGQKNSSNVVSQQVLYFLFDVAVSAKEQTSGEFREWYVGAYFSPGSAEIYNLSEWLRDVAKIISLKNK